MNGTFLVQMRRMAAIGSLGFIVWLVAVLDDWHGVLAFELRYLCFSAAVAALLAGIWPGGSRQSALIAGGAAFAVLLMPYFASEPSARILRGVMNDVSIGMPQKEVEERVRLAYSDSQYAMPKFIWRPGQLQVSLYTQEAGDCTAGIFHLTDQKVVGSEFSAD